MIDILERNLSFFRLLRNNKRIIESFDIDSQFASVIDYLNDVIVPAINDMQAGALPGIMGSANYFLTNVGDGSVTFNTLDRVIPDKTIATTKIEKYTAKGKVLVSNNAGELDLASGPTHANMVLTYRNGDVPQYRFINTINIEDRAITYADIADRAIIKEHLHQEILDIIDAAVPNVNEQNNIVITGNYFGNLSITTDKFALNTIATSNKLGIINNVLPPNPKGLYNVVTRNKVKNGTITPDKIKPDTIGALNFNKVQCITQNKLASNIVDETWLLASPNIRYILPVTTSNDSGFFYDSYLSSDFRISRRSLMRSTPENAIVCKDDFTWEVKRAFERAGCW
jgi:hypothetical protein